MKRTLNTIIILILAIGFFNSTTAELDKFETKVAVIKFKTEVIDFS